MLGALWMSLLVLIGILAPLLANEHPILCKFDGELHAPALVDTLRGLPFVSRWLRKDRPFRLASFDYHFEFDPERGDWHLPTPLGSGPNELIGRPLERPSSAHWLGTDTLGRDVLARLVHGASVSVRVGFLSMAIAAAIGILVGSVAGYCGRWADALLSRVMDIVLCFPTLPFVLAILAWFPPRLENLILTIGLISWVSIARYTRSELLRLRGLDFTLAARALGAGPVRIVRHHLLPNSLAPVLVNVTFGISAAILVEAALSWIGFGVQPPRASWGNLLQDGYRSLGTSSHIIWPVCIALFLTILSLNLVGDTLRDLTDPQKAERSRAG